MEAATWRFTGNPIETKVIPDEYRSRIAPPTSPRIATSAKGIKYQVGSIVVSAPIGSDAIALLKVFDEPASSAPYITSTTGIRDEPNTVQKITPALEVFLGRYLE